MGIFRGRKVRTAGGAVVSDRNAGRADLDALRAFAESRKGVEAYIEPKTSVTQTTLLLVAGDGESIRRRVASPQAARDFSRKKLNVPVYDANLVGVPTRKREYDLRKAKGATPPTRTTASPPPRQTPKELAAIMTLESIAGVEPLPSAPSFDQLMRVYKKARSRSHPDRVGGARERWDTVEEAARTLGLPD
ncbi:hypothetical protein [Aeromicrobium sp. A1-2]|uniref:hypothetical protein n=1 Tax=Aeromicrobium sp. A1-2 TaxID=2107713 RepID=UPI001C1F2230|nr:hypothetical protein [Aeromicrobium sp. A1-2]